MSPHSMPHRWLLAISLTVISFSSSTLSSSGIENGLSLGKRLLVPRDGNSSPTLGVGPWVDANSLETSLPCMRNSAGSGCYPPRDAISACTAQCQDAFYFNCGDYNYGALTNKTCVCSHYPPGACQRSCQTRPERLAFYAWLNKTCSDEASWHGLPANWTLESGALRDDLAILDINNALKASNRNFEPSCLRDSSLRDFVIDFKPTYPAPVQNCDIVNRWVHCIITDKNEAYPRSISENSYLDRSCACDNLEYRNSCGSRCSLWFERTELIEWINLTCAGNEYWESQTEEWSKLVGFLPSDLMPWAPTVKWMPDNSSVSGAAPKTPHSCPSDGAKLGVFAAVNIAMAICMPLLGRRTVVQRITFGLLGKPNSSGWLFTGPLVIALHFASNVVNTYLIKSTPGYSQVNFWELVLLWFTRPRLSWMIVILMPWGAEDSMYLAVTASAMVAELMLQLLSTYTLGRAVQYGRHARLYHVHTLGGVPRGRDATIMYAGALIWLTVLFFALLVCLMTISNINDTLRASSRWITQNLQRRAVPDVYDHDLEFRLLQRMVPPPGTDESHAADSNDALMSSQAMYRRSVARLKIYLDEDAKTLKRLKKQKRAIANSIQQRRTQGPQGYVPQEMIDEAHQITLALSSHMETWVFLPAEQVSEARERHKVAMEIRDAVYHAWKDDHFYRPIWGDASSFSMPGSESLEPEYLKHMFKQWNQCEYDWKTVLLEWERCATKRFEEKNSSGNAEAKLRSISHIALFGMFGCWFSQWLWWIGFVRTMDNNYCPPKLTQLGVIWTVFSAFGALSGGSF